MTQETSASCKMKSLTLILPSQVASGLMVAIGIYARLSKEAGAVDSLLADPSLILLTVGILMFAITFVGCTGALRDLPVLLKMVRRGQWDAAFLMGKAISSYRDDLDLQNLIDYIQKKFECCGVHSYKDWSQNIYFECQDSNPSLERCAVPFSCCQGVFNTMCGYGTQNLSPWRAESLIYTEGCLEKIVGWGQRNLLLVAGLATGLFVLEVIETVTASRLCLNQKSASDEVNPLKTDPVTPVQTLNSNDLKLISAKST
uniref:Tetraspanin n=1 Tax=Pelusios castaneus TaxID=367368 RepID=A0A8C8S9D3_9SAUR